jgi:hypothetical protein
MAITTSDHEIRNYLERVAITIDHYTEVRQTHSVAGGSNPNCWDVQFYPNEGKRGKGNKNLSKIWALFKSSMSGGYKNILPVFLTSSYQNRLALLAGIIDADGSLDGSGFEISSKDQFLLDDICFLARSLGFAAYRKTRVINKKQYFRTHISGDCDLIPTKLRHKKAPPRKQPKDVLATGIKEITPLGPGPYSGFTLDGDGRFLLGDFTVTHNTFSLRQWASVSRKGGIATSFSKSTVQELARKLSGRFPAQTLHSLGLSALKSGRTSPKLDDSKVFNLVKNRANALNLPFDDQEPIRKLARLGKTYGIQPDPLGPEGLILDELSIWETLADQYDIDITDTLIEHAREVIIESNNLALKEGLIDFDDMLYISLIYPHRFPRFPVILADEVQDFNALQHTMLKRCLMPNGRIIAAGDDRQAIYAFRGALSDSYSLLVQRFQMSELPLTVSFRCPSEVIKVAQHYVPDIEAAPGCPQGAVLHPENLTLDEVPPVVLCRNNAPLIRLALALLVEGRTAEVAGKDIGKGLINLTKRITKKNLPSPEFLERLRKWREREIAKHPRRKPRIEDKFLALKALADAQPDLAAVQHHLEKLYPDPNSRGYRPAEVHLSTIHRAKGREWPRVLFLDPQLLPSKYATQDWELLQEDNLAYVGVTRAQEELIFCPSSDIDGLEDNAAKE